MNKNWIHNKKVSLINLGGYDSDTASQIATTLYKKMRAKKRIEEKRNVKRNGKDNAPDGVEQGLRLESGGQESEDRQQEIIDTQKGQRVSKKGARPNKSSDK